MCPRRSRPRSAAKQGRSFRVAPINSAPTRFSGGHILGKGPPRDRPPAQAKTHILRKEFNVAKSGLRLQISIWTDWAGGFWTLTPWSPDPKIRKWALECACVPKGVGAAFCSKTAPFLSYAPNKPSGGSCAQGSQGHVLQQNGAVLFV